MWRKKMRWRILEMAVTFFGVFLVVHFGFRFCFFVCWIFFWGTFLDLDCVFCMLDVVVALLFLWVDGDVFGVVCDCLAVIINVLLG